MKAIRVSSLLVLAAAGGAWGCGSDDNDDELGAPTGVMASDGTSVDQVDVTWDPVDGAIAYRVFRDGAQIAEVSGTEHADAGAAAGGPPFAPAELTASEGTFTDRVALSWAEALWIPQTGLPHDYSVIAVTADRESASSDSDAGYRAAFPITHYELSIDGGDHADVGLVTSVDDLTAPPPTLTAGAAIASDGCHDDHVDLSLAGAGTAPGGERTYLVRAVNAAGAGLDSPPATGYRGVGPLTYQWQRSAADTDADYADLPGATAETFADFDGPAASEGRFYRCLVSAEGTEPALSIAARGWRWLQPSAVPSDMWITDGWVQDMAWGSGRLYISGFFDYVGPPTGTAAAVDITTGAPDLSWPRVEGGTVLAVAADGSGGWYIGGSFWSVDGVPRTHLAHITSAGTLDPSWAPVAAGDFSTNFVYALAVGNGKVYAGGEFETIDGEWHPGLAALDATTGAVAPWTTDTGSVYALALSGNILYIGGTFGGVNLSSRQNLAALNATTGAVRAWNPGANGEVNELLLSGTTIYAAGAFSTIGGQPRDRLAALDTGSNTALAWNPAPFGSVNAIAVNGSTVYVGGTFTNIGGQARSKIAALDATTGAATSWNPGAGGESGTVHALALSGNTVLAGGDFITLGGQPRNHVGAVDATTGVTTAWSPHASDTATTLAITGSTVYVGGSFRSIGGVLRNGLASLDTATGLATAWNPVHDLFVDKMVVDGDIVYATGSFDVIGGQPRNGLAALDAITGEVTDWDPAPDGPVSTLGIAGGTIYVGGTFTNIGGQARNGIAALDATGAATAWDPDCDGEVHVLAVAGTTVYVGGYFTSIGGQPRRSLAALDAVTGAATSWDAHADWEATIGTISVRGNHTIYISGGGFNTIGGQPRTNVAALDALTGDATAFDPGLAFGPMSLVADSCIIYMGGSYTTISGQPRSRIAALDGDTAAVKAWDPGADNWVDTLLVAEGNVYAGGTFTEIGGLEYEQLAVFAP